MVKFHHEFTVPLSLSQAWDALSHVDRFTPYLPGVRLQQADDGSITGSTDLQVGPIRLQYNGFGEFIEKDADRHRAVLAAHAVDGAGRPTAQATVDVRMHPVSEQQTRLVVDSSVRLTAAGFQASMKQAGGWRVATPPGKMAAGGMRFTKDPSVSDTPPKPQPKAPVRTTVVDDAAGAPPATDSEPAAADRSFNTGLASAAAMACAARQRLRDPRIAAATGLVVGLAAAAVRHRRGPRA